MDKNEKIGTTFYNKNLDVSSSFHSKYPQNYINECKTHTEIEDNLKLPKYQRVYSYGMPGIDQTLPIQEAPTNYSHNFNFRCLNSLEYQFYNKYSTTNYIPPDSNCSYQSKNLISKVIKLETQISEQIFNVDNINMVNNIFDAFTDNDSFRIRIRNKTKA